MNQSTPSRGRQLLWLLARRWSTLAARRRRRRGARRQLRRPRRLLRGRAADPEPGRCRSAASSPTTTTRTWRRPGIGLTLRDASCSGATTADMTNPQNVEPDGPNPPQFNSLDAEHDGRLADDRRQRHRLLRSRRELHHAQPVQPSLPRQIRRRRGRPAESERIEATAPKVAAVLQGIHSPLALGENLRRQLPGDLPGDRVRLLAADADRVPGRALPALDRAAAELDAGDAGGGQRRDAGQLVQRQHRPRRLQGQLDPLGRTAGAGRTRRPRSIPTRPGCRAARTRCWRRCVDAKSSCWGMRIASLVPSATEMLFALGLGGERGRRHPRVRLPAGRERAAAPDGDGPAAGALAPARSTPR